MFDRYAVYTIFHLFHFCFSLLFSSQFFFLLLLLLLPSFRCVFIFSAYFFFAFLSSNYNGILVCLQLTTFQLIRQKPETNATDANQGKDLPAKDLSGTSDPYVRVTLLPDKKHRLETKIKRRTLNPRWNETFYFEGFPIQKLNTRVLHLHVFDYDRFSRDDSIGEVFLPLCQVSVLSARPPRPPACHPLQDI